MPTYEFECLRCKTRWEALLKFSEPPPGFCLECGGQLKKLISRPNVILPAGQGYHSVDKRGPQPED